MLRIEATMLENNTPAPTIISFRHLLTGVLDEFLAGEQMTCPGTTEAIAELLTTLARYREEGAAFFPSVFVCDDRAALLRALDGADALELGVGSRSAETVRRATKISAPLGRGGWNLFLERRSDALAYGVFRSDNFALCETPFERLRRTTDPSARMIGVVQLAENVLELRGGSGAARYLYLSGARTTTLPPETIARFVDAVTREVQPRARRDVRTFYRRFMLDVMRASHGSLLAVLPAAERGPACFADGVMLREPISIEAAVLRHIDDPTAANRAAIQGLARLVGGMVGCDGITVFGADGTVRGFNLFIDFGETQRPGPIGGARRRTFEALSRNVGADLVAAFYRSQDGASECRLAEYPTG